MKNPKVIAREKLHLARRWVFRWRGLDGTPLRGLLSLLIVSGIFFLFAATVRVRVDAPQQWVEKKASIIHFADKGEADMWALRAREGGPFPVRLDPAEWEKAAGLDHLVVDATRVLSLPYEPGMRDLPAEEAVPALPVSPSSGPVFPKPGPGGRPPVAPVPSRLVPALFPLDGVAASDVPADLPPFGGEVDAAMASAPWRFLVRLRKDGTVAQCDPLLDEPGGPALARWLAQVAFAPAVAARSEWISLGVGFVNQPVR